MSGTANGQRWIVAAVWMLCLALGPGVARPAPPLPLATFEFPPYNYLENGEIVGAGTEIVSQLVRRMGYEPVIEHYPWKRTKILVAEGRAAGIFTFTENAWRHEKYHITDPIGTIFDVFFKRKESDITWRTMDDLKDRIIGATDGYNYAPVFLQPMKNGQLQVDLIASQKPEIQHLKKLAKGRVDLVICEINLCGHIIRKNPRQFRGIDHIDKKIGPVRNFYVGFSRKWPNGQQLAERFNRELARFTREGGLKRIHQKYGIVSNSN